MDAGASGPTVPGAPTNVSAGPAPAAAIVKWTAANNGGSALLGYTVVSSPGGQTAVAGAGATSVTVPGLTVGQDYVFRVYASNLVGDGPESAPSNILLVITVPQPPTGVIAVGGDADATVSWIAPLDDGDGAITGYIVMGSGSDGSTTTATTAETDVVVNGLTNGISYTFTVMTGNPAGNSAPSASSAAVVPATVPDAPTNVAATAGVDSATVTWTAPFDGGSVITKYTVTSNPGGIIGTTTGALTATVGGLTAGVNYTFTVFATNIIGNGPPSSSSNGTAPHSATVPGAPTDVTATAGEEAATVSWMGPSSDGGSGITKYTVTSNPGGVIATTTGALTATVSGLMANASYTFTVFATNIVGNGPSSVPSNAVTPYGGQSCDALNWVTCPAGSVCTQSNYSECAAPDYSASDGVVTDLTTGLIWQQTAPAGKYDWDPTAADTSSAQYYCANLSLPGYPAGWRLPSLVEFYTLVDIGDPSTIDGVAFPNTATEGYWTSTVDASDPGTVWVLNFYAANFPPSGSATNFPPSGGGTGTTIGVRCVY